MNVNPGTCHRAARVPDSGETQCGMCHSASEIVRYSLLMLKRRGKLTRDPCSFIAVLLNKICLIESRTLTLKGTGSFAALEFRL